MDRRDATMRDLRPGRRFFPARQPTTSEVGRSGPGGRTPRGVPVGPTASPTATSRATASRGTARPAPSRRVAPPGPAAEGRAGRTPAGQVRATGAAERRSAGGFQPRRRPRSWPWREAQPVSWRESGLHGLVIVCLLLATVILFLSWLAGSLDVVALGSVLGLWGLCAAGWAILGRPGVDWTVPTRRLLADCARSEPLGEPAASVRHPDTAAETLRAR